MNETLTALSTDDIQKKYQNMKLAEKILLLIKRLTVWLAWLAVTVIFVFFLSKLFNLSTETCPGLNNISLDLESAFDTAVCYLKLYSTTLVITIANLILPIIVSLIVTFEDYSPKTRLIVDLVRSIVFRLSGLCVVMGHYVVDNR